MRSHDPLLSEKKPILTTEVKTSFFSRSALIEIEDINKGNLSLTTTKIKKPKSSHPLTLKFTKEKDQTSEPLETITLCSQNTDTLMVPNPAQRFQITLSGVVDDKSIQVTVPITAIKNLYTSWSLYSAQRIYSNAASFTVAENIFGVQKITPSTNEKCAEIELVRHNKPVKIIFDMEAQAGLSDVKQRNHQVDSINLLVAITERDTDMVKKLVEMKANLDQRLRDNKSFTRYFDMVAQAQAELSQVESNNLLAAVTCSDTDMVKKLVEMKANLEQRTPPDQGYRTALLEASYLYSKSHGQNYKLETIIRHLIEQGADINAQDILGNTILHDLVRPGCSCHGTPVGPDFVKYLIENGANLHIANILNHRPSECFLAGEKLLESLVMNLDAKALIDSWWQDPTDGRCTIKLIANPSFDGDYTWAKRAILNKIMSLEITSSLGLANEKTTFLDNEGRSHTYQPHIEPPKSKDCAIKSLLLLDSTLEINLKRPYNSELMKYRMSIILEVITGKKMSPQPTNDLEEHQPLKPS